MHVIEGTWEEIKRHESELVGRDLRVIVDADQQTERDASIDARLKSIREFIECGVPGVVVDDTREGIYGPDGYRG
jgi:hypothetical protein